MKQGFWILGWSDQVANLNTTPNCIVLADVQGNGSYNLVVAEQTQRLICYKNTNVAWDTRLADKPIGMTFFYGDATGQPCISIACGNFVYNYKIFKAFYKTQVPNIPLKQYENEVWVQYQKDRNLKNLINKLTLLQQKSLELSYKTLELLCYSDQEKQQELAEKHSENLFLEDCITCIEALRKSPDDDKTQGQLIVGTELKFLYIFNQVITAIEKTIELPGTPIQICAISQNELIILFRENNFGYFNINSNSDQQIISLQSKPIQMVRQLKSVFISTMDRTVQKFTERQKDYSLTMQYNILIIESVLTGKGAETKALLVGLDNQTIQFYRELQLVSVITLECNVAAMKFGYFGQNQEGFLITISTKGGLQTRSLSREFEKKKQIIIENEPIKQIEFPAVTNLFFEQFEREKQQGQEMLRTYQFDLLRMRLKAAQTYLNILSDQQLAPQLNQNHPLKISTNVEGLGPKFKVYCIVENLTNSPIKNVYVNYVFNSEIYQPSQLTHQLSYLIPNYQKYFECYFTNIHSNGISDVIRIILYQDSKILIQATIQMPMSELE